MQAAVWEFERHTALGVDGAACPQLEIADVAAPTYDFVSCWPYAEPIETIEDGKLDALWSREYKNIVLSDCQKLVDKLETSELKKKKWYDDRIELMEAIVSVDRHNDYLTAKINSFRSNIDFDSDDSEFD